jgi:putative flippase GtrA
VVSKQFVRFMLVGGFNTVFGYSLFAVLIWFNLPYPVAIGLATLGGIALNFQTTGRLVFGGAPLSRATRFVAVYGVVYVLNVAGVAAMLGLGLGVYMANGVVIIPLALVTYVLQRKFVFHTL